MLAELVDHVIGIDPDRDWITAAVVDADTTGVIATERFAANSDGYNEAFGWADAHTEAGERAWAIEGHRQQRARLDRRADTFGRVGHRVRPTTSTRDQRRSEERRTRRGSSRARSPRTRTAASTPSARRAPRSLACARRDQGRSSPSAHRSDQRTQSVPGDLGRLAAQRATRSHHQSTRQEVRGDARLQATTHRTALHAQHTSMSRPARPTPQRRDQDPRPSDPSALGRSRVPARCPARHRPRHRRRVLHRMVTHPGRCRNEAAYARLGGVAPLPGTSGQEQTRHRLNRNGDRDLNHALYIVAMTRPRRHPDTIAYRARRRAEGRTDREITAASSATSHAKSGDSSSTPSRSNSPLDEHRRIGRTRVVGRHSAPVMRCLCFA